MVKVDGYNFWFSVVILLIKRIDGEEKVFLFLILGVEYKCFLVFFCVESRFGGCGKILL